MTKKTFFHKTYTRRYEKKRKFPNELLQKKHTTKTYSILKQYEKDIQLIESTNASPKSKFHILKYCFHHTQFKKYLLIFNN